MKSGIFYIFTFFSLVLLFSCNQGGAPKDIKVSSFEDSVSYSLGANIGQNIINDFKRNKIDSVLDMDILINALSDALKEKDLMLAEADARRIMQEFSKQQTKKQFEPIVKEGEEFLAKNKEREGVVTLPSGLQYEVLTEGAGEKPTKTDKVRVHYAGTLINGTEFDSSIKRGKPAEFGVTGVISGWTEALQLMPVGSKWKLFIPYNLAYGERGSGRQIKPFSTLIFEVELLDIIKKEENDTASK